MLNYDSMKAAITNFEVIIRKNCNIKSRQWWLKYLKKLKGLLIKQLPKSKIELVKKSNFTLLITNNSEIQKLNHKHRKINKPTDVLSFHLNQKEQIKNKYLGDILISYEKAKKQAKEKHFPVESELLMLLIHGYLHLLGYDHKLKKDAKQMFALQNKLLLEIIFY